MIRNQSIDPKRIFVSLLLLILAQSVVLVLVRPAAAVPSRQELLPPSDDPYLLDFLNPEIQQGWQAQDGNWSFADGVYTQTDIAAANAFSLYNRPIQGDYQYTVDLRKLGGELGGGLLFNALQADALDNAFAIRFAQNGAEVEWGFFSGGGFIRQDGVVLQGATGGDGSYHRLQVTVTGSTYAIRFEDQILASAVGFEPHGTAYIGLFVTGAAASFTNAQVLVKTVALETATPTETPTATATETATATSTTQGGATPTFTLTPTVTGTTSPTVDTGLLAPGAEHTLVVDNPALEPTDWLKLQQLTGQWAAESGVGYRQSDVNARNAMVFQRRRVNGDYTYRVRFRFDGEGADPFAGLLFNGFVTQVRNGVYFVRFDGDNRLQWGYFVNDQVTLAVNGESSLDRAQFQLNQEFVEIQVQVTSDLYTISVNGVPVANATNVRFVPLFLRQPQPFIGLYTDNANALFQAGAAKVNVTQYIAATPTATPTVTPITPTPTFTYTPETPTVTPTWTPRPVTPTWTWTPTFTPFPTSPLPTPTWTFTPVGVGTAVVTTPVPAFDSPVQAADFAAQTATAQAFYSPVQGVDFAAQTATAQAFYSPVETPTWTPPPVFAEVAVPMAESPLAAPAVDTPLPPTPEVVAIMITATPLPTQRAISTPPPPPTPDSLLMVARMIDSAIAAAGWLWFMAGSLIFFTVAGILAGLGFRQQEARRFELVEEEPLPGIPPESSPPSASAPTRPAPDEWPSSLP